MANAKRGTSVKAARWTGLYRRLMQVGTEAGNKARPDAIIVTDHRTGQEWHEPEGMCGFAWVNITPGTSSFARWLTKNGYAHKSYYGGVDLWIAGFGQSYDRKQAAAFAMAALLREEGIEARAMSRLD